MGILINIQICGPNNQPRSFRLQYGLNRYGAPQGCRVLKSLDFMEIAKSLMIAWYDP